MRILLITTHSLATNPRLVKEIDLFVKRGCAVTVVCFEFDNWSATLNDQLLKQFEKVKIYLIPANRKVFYPWVMSTIVQKVSKSLLLLFPGNSMLISFSYFKHSYRLKNTLDKMPSEFDWIIAHNPGSFWVSKYYAEKHKIKLHKR